jgi:hypothetical protein
MAAILREREPRSRGTFAGGDTADREDLVLYVL